MVVSFNFTVTIERLGNYPIKGIMLQARRAQCDHTHQAIPLGQFLEPKETALKTMNCSGIAVGLRTTN